MKKSDVLELVVKTAIVYGIFLFFTWQLNPLEWSEISKILAFIVWVILLAND